MNVKSLLSVAALAAAMVGTSAKAETFLDFCVDASPTYYTSASNTALENDATTGCAGAGAQTGQRGFVADLLNGSYNEKVLAALDGGGNLVFASTTLISFGQLLRNEGSSPINAGQSGLGVGYGLYAIVRATGSISGNSFAASSASLELYLDRDQLTSMEMSNIDDGTLNVAVGGDDVLLGSTNNLLSGSGTTNAGLGTDGFAVTFNDFALTAGGEGFFIAPRPFHIRVYSDGDINDGSVAIVPGVTPLQFSGDVSAVFSVPEPTSLALVGLALAGIGAFGGRRKRA